MIDLFDGDFKKHGMDVYRAYCGKLKEMLGEENYLHWTVEDG